MRALSIALALLLAYARGFTLDARGWPSTDDAVAEARYATNTYRARNGSLEFVHVHKCAGTTVNLHVSALLCAGRPDDVATPGDHRAVGEACANVQTPVADRETVAAWRRTPCRLVRPHPVDARRSLALIAETYGAAPRFVSAHEEWSAFEISWRPKTTYKAVVVRSPYAWSAGATPHHNAGADDACAAAANFSAGDEAAFVARLAADGAVYDAAAAVLGARLAAAARADWGGVGASCGGDVVAE